MTYYETARGIKITKKRAIQELKDHGVITMNRFFRECGEKEYYKAQEVLNWLGY